MKNLLTFNFLTVPENIDFIVFDPKLASNLVPLYFIRAHQSNLTYKRYLKVENGKTNHDKPHWQEAMNSFIDWTNP